MLASFVWLTCIQSRIARLFLSVLILSQDLQKMRTRTRVKIKVMKSDSIKSQLKIILIVKSQIKIYVGGVGWSMYKGRIFHLIPIRYLEALSITPVNKLNQISLI